PPGAFGVGSSDIPALRSHDRSIVRPCGPKRYRLSDLTSSNEPQTERKLLSGPHATTAGISSTPVPQQNERRCAMSYLKQHGTRRVPQWSPIPGSDQVPNSAGGFAWAIEEWT